LFFVIFSNKCFQEYAIDVKKPFVTYFIEQSYQNLLKPVFFMLDPEWVHDRMTQTGELLGNYKLTKALTKLCFSYYDPSLEQELWGINFENPIGLSAGFDKDGHLLNILPDVGFGFAEIGSVTLEPYEGNPKPRLWRLLKSKALIVWYGLKNDGVKKFVKRIRSYGKLYFVFGVSVAKTNCSATKNDKEGVRHYKECLQELIKNKIGRFYVINISCPNTFGGEPFTTKEKLDSLLSELIKVKTEKPILVKMPINLPWKDFEGLVSIVVKHKMAGVIIGNLNKDHKDKSIKDQIPAGAQGGISGKATTKLCNELIKQTYRKYGEKIKIVGVGGVFDGKDAYEKIKLGATLVEMITGMIFGGPQTIGQINRELAYYLKKDGFSNISEAIGSGNRVK
jgi:dihydroorotate dehydrogenase